MERTNQENVCISGTMSSCLNCTFCIGFIKIHLFTEQLFTYCVILTIIKGSKFKLLGRFKKKYCIDSCDFFSLSLYYFIYFL